MATKEQLLESVRGKNSRSGIITADRYFRDVQGCFDSGACPIDSSICSESDWKKSIKEAETKFTYNGPGFEIVKDSITESIGSGIAMVTCRVTTPKRDRDKDVLVTSGAQLDPKSPFLWQHIPMQPVGGLVDTVNHNEKELVVRVALADTALARDTLELIKVGGLRISHGFDPIEWEMMEDEEGWKFLKFLIYEISGVSIPSNTDADFLEVVMSEKNFQTDLVKRMLDSRVKESGGYNGKPISVTTGTRGSESFTKSGDSEPEVEKKSCSCNKGKKEIDLSVTDAMISEAKRGLAWREEYGRGGTEVGIARARDISNGKDLSRDTWKRMKSFFARHEVDKEAEGFSPGEDGYPSNGRIAWALWGGDAGQSRAEKIVSQIESEEEKGKMLDMILEGTQKIADTMNLASKNAKAGSRISQATRAEIANAVADLEAIRDTEELPRSVIALANQAISCLNSVAGCNDDSEKEFSAEAIKRKFFALLVEADVETIEETHRKVGDLLSASKSIEEENDWGRTLSEIL